MIRRCDKNVDKKLIYFINFIENIDVFWEWQCTSIERTSRAHILLVVYLYQTSLPCMNRVVVVNARMLGRWLTRPFLIISANEQEALSAFVSSSLPSLHIRTVKRRSEGAPRC